MENAHVFVVWSPAVAVVLALFAVIIFAKAHQTMMFISGASILSGFTGLFATGVAQHFESGMYRVLSRVLDFNNETITAASLSNKIASLDAAMFILQTELEILEVQCLLLLWVGSAGLVLAGGIMFFRYMLYRVPRS